MIFGYVVIKPDFPECITDFGMLWFEDETTTSAASSWVLEANAAAALVTEKAAADRTSGNCSGEHTANNVRGTPWSRVLSAILFDERNR